MSLSRLFPDPRRTESAADPFVVLFFSLLGYLFLMLGQILLSFLLPSGYGAILALLGSAAVILPILLFCRITRKPPLGFLYLSGKQRASRFFLGFFGGILGLLVLIFPLLLLGAYEFKGITLDALWALPLLFLAFLVQGSAEELLCRGFLMAAFSERYGGAYGAIASSVFFALLHVMNQNASFFGLLNIFLFGLLFSSITQKGGSILPACGAHAGWNFCLRLLGVQVSGARGDLYLLALESKKDFLSGGAFGPEGSPILSVFLLVALLLLSFPSPMRSAKHQKSKRK